MQLCKMLLNERKCDFMKNFENSVLFDFDVIITNKYYNFYDYNKKQIYENYKNDKTLCEQYQHYNYLHYRFMLYNFKHKNCIYLIFDDNIVVAEFNNDNSVNVYDFAIFYDAACIIDELTFNTTTAFFDEYIKNKNVEKIIKTYCNL